MSRWQFQTVVVMGLALNGFGCAPAAPTNETPAESPVDLGVPSTETSSEATPADDTPVLPIPDDAPTETTSEATIKPIPDGE